MVDRISDRDLWPYSLDQPGRRNALQPLKEGLFYTPVKQNRNMQFGNLGIPKVRKPVLK